MANKLFEKIESDALAAIDAIDAEYDMHQLDFEVCDIIALFEAGNISEKDYLDKLQDAYVRHGVTERQYQDWCQKQDEPFLVENKWY